MVPSAATFIRWIDSWRHNRPVWTNSSDMFLDYMLHSCQCTVLNCQISRLKWQLCMPHYFLPCDVCKIHSFVAKWSIRNSHSFTKLFTTVVYPYWALWFVIYCNVLLISIISCYHMLFDKCYCWYFRDVLLNCQPKRTSNTFCKRAEPWRRPSKQRCFGQLQSARENTLWFHGLVGPVGDAHSSHYKYTYIICVYVFLFYSYIYIYVYMCVYVFIYAYIYMYVCECVYIYIYLCENARNQKMCLRFGICCRNRPGGQAVTARPFKTYKLGNGRAHVKDVLTGRAPLDA